MFASAPDAAAVWLRRRRRCPSYVQPNHHTTPRKLCARAARFRVYPCSIVCAQAMKAIQQFCHKAAAKFPDATLAIGRHRAAGCCCIQEPSASSWLCCCTQAAEPRQVQQTPPLVTGDILHADGRHRADSLSGLLYGSAVAPAAMHEHVSSCTAEKQLPAAHQSVCVSHTSLCRMLWVCVAGARVHVRSTGRLHIVRWFSKCMCSRCIWGLDSSHCCMAVQENRERAGHTPLAMHCILRVQSQATGHDQ